MINLNQVLHMNGYGIYVWPAYLFTLCLFSYLAITTLVEKSRIWKKTSRLISLSKTEKNNVVFFSRKQEPQREII